MSTSDSLLKPLRSTPRRAFALGAAVLLVLGGIAAWRLHRSVQQAMTEPAAQRRPLSFVALATPRETAPRWGSSDIVAVVATADGLLFAGGDGMRRDKAKASEPLPTLRVSAATAWRGHPVVALAAGGLFRAAEGRWEEMRTGWGTLHGRALVETEAGELLVGAQEGLFRVAWGEVEMERLSAKPIRSIATGKGFVLAGGEAGLVRITSGREETVALPDGWVETVALVGETSFVSTPSALLRQTAAGFAPVPGAEVGAGVAWDGAFWAPTVPAEALVVRVDEEGALSRETLPAIVRRTTTTGGALFADTDRGLYARGREGWELVRERAAVLPDGHAHIGAMARHHDRLHVGLFDGGLLAQNPGGGFGPVAGSAAWAVNALLSSGGELHVASLRGAARYDGRALREVKGPGAAFALAETRDGIAIGYAQGVLLPGAGLLSAFHGLPGNQALALSEGDELLVGTPTGLGALSGRRVLWRVTTGEGKLPHPWVTALARSGSAVFVGTFGGGVARRRPGTGSRTGVADDGVWDSFPETAGLKLNTGCLVSAAGRIYAGTDGRGVWATGPAQDRFERLELFLPSPRVTALLVDGGTLWIGTDEGLTRIPLPTGAGE